MHNTCFPELLIKICRAVINSLKIVTGSNPHQGQRGAGSFALPWIIGLGKDRDSRGSELQRGCAGPFWAPASMKPLLPAPVCSRLTLSWTCSDSAPDFPLLIYFYHCKWK